MRCKDSTFWAKVKKYSLKIKFLGIEIWRIDTKVLSLPRFSELEWPKPRLEVIDLIWESASSTSIIHSLIYSNSCISIQLKSRNFSPSMARVQPTQVHQRHRSPSSHSVLHTSPSTFVPTTRISPPAARWRCS